MELTSKCARVSDAVLPLSMEGRQWVSPVDFVAPIGGEKTDGEFKDA